MSTRRDLLAMAGGFGAAMALGATPIAAQDGAPAEAVEALPPVDPNVPQIVPIVAGIPAGELHIDPNRFALYWTLPEGLAIRYRVGIGRPGLYESGTFFVGAKKEWPDWTPTPEMIERDPGQYARWADGMPGGPANPLGARALYLFTPERGDTFLRIHGTNAPGTIGRRVSNGCARLVNDEIIDLYERVPMNARVILYPARDA